MELSCKIKFKGLGTLYHQGQITCVMKLYYYDNGEIKVTQYNYALNHSPNNISTLKTFQDMDTT